MKLVFIQSFSLGDVGGGAKILRSVADHAPVSVSSVCTGFGRSQTIWTGSETLIPIRPSLGRLDRTRFHWIGGYVEQLWLALFQRRLEAHLLRVGATDVHLLPHGWGDFDVGFRVASHLGLRVHVSIHDDFLYTARSHPDLKRMEKMLGCVWREASTRFVISQEMGLEYCRRYGERSYVIHTDGTDPRERFKFEPPSTEVNLYFMGMFNHAYIPNFMALLKALEKHHAVTALGQRVQFTVRTHGFNVPDYPGKEIVKVLPFANVETVEAEMRLQHLLYLPLPLEAKWEKLCRFSLSTKMVSYLAVGVPILYHGPQAAAVGQYLQHNNAAIHVNTNNPDVIAQSINNALKDSDRLVSISENAQGAACRDFDAQALKERFWAAILGECILPL